MNKNMDKEQKNRKKTYRSPKVFTFGGIANLTQQNVKSTVSDAGNNLMAVASF
jgi:hypothetical protein